MKKAALWVSTRSGLRADADRATTPGHLRRPRLARLMVLLLMLRVLAS
jgi:hypothetical protein